MTSWDLPRDVTEGFPGVVVDIQHIDDDCRRVGVSLTSHGDDVTRDLPRDVTEGFPGVVVDVQHIDDDCRRVCVFIVEHTIRQLVALCIPLIN